MSPSLVVALPGLVAGLAGAGDRIGAPELLTGIRVQRIDMVAGAPVAAAAADDQLVADDQRRPGQRIAVLRIVDLDRLDQFTGVAVGPVHLAVAGHGYDEILVERDPAVRRDPDI